jgi:hypothetical protein
MPLRDSLKFGNVAKNMIASATISFANQCSMQNHRQQYVFPKGLKIVMTYDLLNTNTTTKLHLTLSTKKTLLEVLRVKHLRH